MRQKSGFEKLEVYQLAEELADAIWQSARRWSAFDRDTLGKQIVRAADSIGANLAEGYGRRTTWITVVLYGCRSDRCMRQSTG